MRTQYEYGKCCRNDRHWEVYLRGDFIGIVAAPNRYLASKEAIELITCDLGLDIDDYDLNSGYLTVIETPYVSSADCSDDCNELALDFPVAEQQSSASDYDEELGKDHMELLEFLGKKEKMLDGMFKDGYRISWKGKDRSGSEIKGVKDIKTYKDAVKYAELTAKSNHSLAVSLYGITDMQKKQGIELFDYKDGKAFYDNSDKALKQAKEYKKEDKAKQKLANIERTPTEVSMPEPEQAAAPKAQEAPAKPATADAPAATTTSEEQPTETATSDTQAATTATSEETPAETTAAETSTTPTTSEEKPAETPETRAKLAAANKAKAQYKKIYSAMQPLLQKLGKTKTDLDKILFADGNTRGKVSQEFKDLYKALFLTK